MPKVTANICKNRHGMFYFRLVIPTRLRTHFPRNKRELRRSLKTDSQTLAIKRARFLRSRFDVLFEELEIMSKDKINRHGLITICDDFLGKVEIDHGDPEKEIAHAKELMELSRKMREQNSSLATPQNSTNATPRISKLAESYLHIKSERSKLDSKTLKEYRAAYDTLIFILGDIEVGNLTPESMNQFYDELRELPSNRNSSPLFKGKSFEELKLIAIPEDKKITTRTANKVMDRIVGLLNYATKQQTVHSNPSLSVVREKDEVHSKHKREAFTDQELKKIFESPHFTKNEWRKRQGRKEPYRFWLPLIALFTGARLAEICQLNKVDINEEDGVWNFNISDEFDAITGSKIKSVKNQNSIRTIPISQKLIDIGILDFISSTKTKELFPELKSKNNGIDSAQKWVNNFLKRCGVHSPYTKTFHSLRHTFITHAINCGIEPKYVGGITGHLSKEEFGLVEEISNTYFKGFSTEVLKIKVIDLMRYPLNFSRTKW